jgi:hypothetical protein
MAFSILAELNQKNTDWKSINKELQEVSNGVVEFFPIPNFLNSGKEYIGISIPTRNFTMDDVEIIRKSIRYFLSGEHKVFELYSSSEFTVDNLETLTGKFFRTK